MTGIAAPSEDEGQRAARAALEVREERGAVGAVDDAVVGGERREHRVAELDAPVGRLDRAPAIPPTARIAACGGSTIAVKEWTPNMPRFETVNVLPVSSSGLRLRPRARSARSRDSAAICASDFWSASKSAGTSSAPSTATAIPTLTREKRSTAAVDQDAVEAGNSRSVSAAARTTKSFTDGTRSTAPRAERRRWTCRSRSSP